MRRALLKKSNRPLNRRGFASATRQPEAISEFLNAAVEIRSVRKIKGHRSPPLLSGMYMIVAFNVYKGYMRQNSEEKIAFHALALNLFDSFFACGIR